MLIDYLGLVSLYSAHNNCAIATGEVEITFNEKSSELGETQVMIICYMQNTFIHVTLFVQVGLTSEDILDD